MHQALRERISALSEPQYRAFSASLLPGGEGIQGVRLPALRRMAREICAGDWREALDGGPDLWFEEIMLRGMVIAGAAMELPERLERVANFVPRIDNWSVCDSFCESLRFAGAHREAVWAFLQPYFVSPREYDQRFALVMALEWFVVKVYLPRVLAALSAFSHEAYYARMAAAWAVSVCFAKFPDETMDWLVSCPLDRDTFRKALSKILDSRRVDESAKQTVRALRRG